jgi:hypothetical protein
VRISQPMENTKRSRRFTGIVLVNLALFTFVAVHMPIFFSVPYIPPRLYIRMPSFVVYTAAYIYVILGLNIKHRIPHSLTRTRIVLSGAEE